MSSKERKVADKTNLTQRNDQQTTQNNSKERPHTPLQQTTRNTRPKVFRTQKTPVNYSHIQKSRSPNTRTVAGNTPISPASKVQNSSHVHTAHTTNNSNLNRSLSRSKVRINYQSPPRNSQISDAHAYFVHYTTQLIPAVATVPVMEAVSVAPVPAVETVRMASPGHSFRISPQSKVPTPRAPPPKPPTTIVHSSVSTPNLPLMKTPHMLEYENRILIKQLQQRDDIILLFKKGWTPNTLPINDEIIKDLNLKICQKNTLIEQIHRFVVQFEDIMQKQKTQISPICKQRLKMLKDIINQHEHLPVIIRQRFIQTGHIIGAVSYPNNQQSHLKLQIQLRQTKQKLQFFQRQNKVLESTLSALKSQSNSKTGDNSLIENIDVEKYTKQIFILKQEIQGYKDQIFELCKNADDHKSQILKLDDNDNKEQVQNLKKEIKRLNDVVNTLSLKDGQISMLREHIQRYKKQIQVFIQKQLKSTNQINQLTIQINQLKTRPVSNTNSQSRIKFQMDQINKNHSLKTAQLERQLQNANLKVKQFQQKVNLLTVESQNWKKHLETAQVYIEQLLKEIQELKSQFKNTKVQNVDQSSKLRLQNTRLSQDIISLNMTIKSLNSQKQRLLQEHRTLNITIQQYQIQIRQFNVIIQASNKKVAESYQNIAKIQEKTKKTYQQSITRLQNEIRNYKTQISSLQKQILGYKQQINRRTNQKTVQAWQLQIQNIKNSYELKIKQSTTNIQQLQLRLKKQSQSTISTLKLQIQSYRNQVAQLRRQVDSYKLQISTLKSQSTVIQNLHIQIQNTKVDYQAKLKDVWQKLNFAQLYILKITANMQQLQKTNAQLLQKSNQPQPHPQQYLYRLDQKYQLITQKLKHLSTRHHDTISSESQFWQSYRQKRKKDLQQMQSAINEALVVVRDVDQAIIVRRSELYRLDLLKLEDLIADIGRVKQSRGQVESVLRESVESRFFGLLRSVAVQIGQ